MTRRMWAILLTVVLASMRPVLGQTCGITNPAQPFSILSISRATNSVTLTWRPTCTNFAFGVFSTDQPLSTNSQYQTRAGMWGSLSGTSQWTDTGVTNRQRFYKVLRIEPTSTSDWNGDGIPDVYDLQYGLNPFDPGDATNDVDGDGYSNWDEFLMGSNPTNSSDPITVYVDAANTNGVYDGSQANPFRSIQDAIESSVDVNSNLAIRVRPGNYYEPVSNLQYNPYSGNLVSTRLFLFIYAANQDWSLSTDPGSHVIDSLGFQHRDLLLFSNAPSAPAVEFNGVTRARINGFTIRGGQGLYGGGIYASPTNNGPIHISNCIIEKNGGAGTEAGGIYIQAGTNSMIYNTVVAKNMGEVGGVYDVNGVRIWSCTIVSNTTLAIWAITATGEPSTTPTNAPTQASLSNYLNQVFGKQANVFMNVLPLVSTNVNYDLNTNDVLDVATNFNNQVSAEQAAITNAAFRSGAINVYYVHSISATNYGLALSYPPLRLAFVGDFHNDSSVNVTAHELGHHLGIPYDVGVPGGPPGLPDRLMGPDSGGDPCRLIRTEWETNNNTAATFH